MAAKKKLCDVKDCSNSTKKTVSREQAGTAIKQANMTLDIRDKVNKVHLCADHYRKIKKQLKKDRQIERLRWG
ncbi:MAG: hypothetical protein JSU57_01925 [Candidatus Heimdallarchaeota archaeon]|nr:MAG: hypothetical protein JSU57_01925 [Candidatus Heimdallarchaeota archaeon]